MLLQFWLVVLDSGYIFFISLMAALEEFHISLCGLADSDPEVCLSLCGHARRLTAVACTLLVLLVFGALRAIP